VNEHDIRFMQHALGLARKGVGRASPNPTVGCVIVRQGEIVGEGFHQYELRDHAEIVALKSAKEKARGATLYVTLEPCSHQGRTGPCTEAIIAAGVGRVVAAMTDPNPVNSGRGLERLGLAGIEVVTEVCEDEARRLNEAFAWWIRTKKPFLTLKSALTLDGQLALPQTGSKGRRSPDRRGGNEWISSEESRAEVHRLRHASDALLTGIGTILADDPLLTDRSGLPRRSRLLRAVLDSKLRMKPNSRVLKTVDRDLLVLTAASLKSPKARKLQDAGAEVVQLKSKNDHMDLQAVLAELGRREILSVLLEAGPTLNGAALAGGMVHRLVLFYAPKIAGESTVPFALGANFKLPVLQNVSLQQFGPDFAIAAYLRDVYKK
jgi:diaminohydroxyphosphoribosylaminopyrimidine deaminase / 5-amino-6-(5-phosphoribosylamino)uracil reductase